jgi:hypothetical protein
MVGMVFKLRRYPVKSMLGQDVAVSTVTRAVAGSAHLVRGNAR